MSDTQNDPQPSNTPPSPASWPPAPPGYEEAAQPAAVRPIFLPISSLSRWLAGLLVAMGALNAFTAVLETAVSKHPTSLVLVSGFALIALLFLIVEIATGICFLVWIYRTYSNLTALGSTGLSSTRGWAVVYYFIPILNLYKPCQLMIETWKASDPSAVASGNSLRWKTSRWSPLIGIWWGILIISNFISAIVETSAIQQTTPHLDTEGNIVSSCGTVLSCLCAAFLVNALSRRQEQAARRLAG